MVERIITGELGVNTYLYNFKDNLVVIIDPGSDAELIKDRIKKSSFIPVAVILTHGHFDHIGAVMEIKKYYNIKVYIHKKDAKYLGINALTAHKEMLEAMGLAGDYYISQYYTDTPEPDVLLEDTNVLTEFSLSVIHTPGHSPGSICLYSKNNNIVFTGDTLFKSGMGRTDFPGGDFNTLERSLNNLLTLPKDTIVYPGHGPESTIAAESNITQLY